MRPRWSKLGTFLALAVWSSSGCGGLTAKRSTANAPAVPNDASGDFPPADLAAELGRSEVTPDAGTDLAPGMDSDARALGLDLRFDAELDLPRGLGPDGSDASWDLSLDLDTDRRDLGDDLPPDVPVRLPLDADLAELEQDGRYDLGTNASLDDGTDVQLDTAAWACTSGEPYVLVLSGNNEGGVYRFYPDTLSLARIGTLSCGSPASELNSFTVRAVGPAYISNLRGELCVVELTTFVASPTNFDATQVANGQYGMAVLPDNVPAGETLYLAVRSAGQADQLARVDLSTFDLTPIGPIELHQDGGAQPCAGIELTPAANGGLYGFAVDTDPALLLAIDPKTGNAVQMAEVPVANPGGFALLDWQGTIYIFFVAAGARGSTVFTFRNGDAQVSRIGAIDTAVIGAGVALCP